MRSIARVVALAALACGGTALAAPVHVVLSDGTAPYREVARALATAIAPARHSVGLPDDPIPAAAELVVAVGTAATTRAVYGAGKRPLVATLLPEAAWDEVTRDSGEGRRTAIFLDQPPSRHVALARVMLPPARELGVVFGPTSTAATDEVHAAAAMHNFRLHTVHAAGADDATAAVATVLRRAEVLLALPDPAVFNRFTVQSVLLTSFRARRPVIGFSDAWVRAGALGAVHTTPEQLGTEAGQVVVRWLAEGGDLPAASHPATFTVTVNRQVAVSLGLHLPTDPVLLQQLRALEAPQ